MKTTTTSTTSLRETITTLEDLFREGMRIGLDMFDTLAGSQPSAMMEQMLRQMAPQLQSAGKCSCHIPPPCWMPRELGEVVSHVCPGGTATLRIRVTNCSISPRDIRIDVPAENVKAQPPVLQLNPMERGTSVLSVFVPPETNKGEEREFLIWVSGCVHHYLRWTVRIDHRGADCCHEIEVEDCTDNIHHWYDHFYCARPCQPRLSTRG